MLLGLEPPSSGEVMLDGRRMGELGRMEVAGLVQPVFQDPYSSLNPRKTIASIISLPLRLQKTAGASDVGKRVDEIMELTGLPRRLAGAYPGQLSGGQRQRVAIARALIARPRLVICDEPTSALDVSIQSQILNMLQALRSELGLTFIIVSHNLAVIEHLADSVIVMSDGEIVERGDVDAIFAAPRHPYTRMLLDSVLTPDPSLGLPAVAV
jgi:peptide/nickel transport system ATP-binding protein